MERAADFRTGGRKPSVARGLRQRLRGSLGPLLLCVLAALLLVLPALAAPALMQVFVDNVLVRGAQDWARPIIFGMILTALVKGFLTAIQLRLLRRLKLKLAVSMSGKFVWHLFQLPADYYAQRYSGEVSSRIVLNDKVADVLSGKLASTVIDILMIAFYAFVMFQFDRMLTAVAIGLAAVNFLILRAMARKRVDGNQRLVQDRGKLNALTISGLQSIRTLKASALESDFFARWTGTFAKVANAEQSIAVSNHYLGLLPRFVSSLMSMSILVAGGFRVIDGAMTIGMLVAFQSLVSSFLAPVNGLLNLGSTLQELEGDIIRLDDVLANPALAAKPPASFPVVKLKGQAELRNIVFSYNPVAPPLIAGLSLTVKPGERIALVGGSGSGKSTIARLIAGLYEPNSGEIVFDDHRRSEIPQSVLANSISVVDQDIVLFAGTVKDNLTLWDPTAAAEDVVQACRDAAIHEDIVSLPEGYESHLIEGAANLSGGQRQRLEIARALVNNPALLILDEATSALDAETERIVDRNIRRRGCSVIMVAHRLSTIRDADEIIVLDQGKVVERGTHQELVLKDGPYLKLISSEGALVEA
jgi:NHLM bacteriocin system ABC transporter peptidase/ATP-binding protein